MATKVVSLDRLKAQLLTSGLSQRNNALFQVIDQLIDYLRQTITETQAQIVSLTPAPPSGGTTIITGGSPMPFDGMDAEESVFMIPGPQGIQGPIGPVGPPGLDGESCDCDCMPFMGNSITTTTGPTGIFTQLIP